MPFRRAPSCATGPPGPDVHDKRTPWRSAGLWPPCGRDARLRRMLGPVSDDVVFVYEATSEVDRQRELDTAGKLLFAAVVDLTTGGHLKAFQTDEANDRTLRLPRAAGRFPHVAVQLTTIEPS